MTPLALASACLLIITLCYGSLCWVSPFGRCRKCNGMGHALKHDRKGRLKRGKDCRRCKGHGIRIRIGRHLLNRGRRIHRNGTR
ncbi:hypothetical protein HRW18_11685 [Streptomyces lunaelactis]|uniref:hypothetical protein n=1 Tax=Streptomyces lunaelactis TaxID=1535768 RepID=UPI0015848D92|nr:hypothetical protein [Streptomyces lunaelactis]NUK08659.1 hypothetical protein [Streptomyces lunaelactis]NUL10750.1 hypothetical protein [Streptomyces lunaelactis]NUL22576.1 hypothetical protein [Streptomyces lunaelactis]